MCAADTHMVTCTVRTYVCMCVPPISSVSYLELLGLFSKLISVKREEVSAARKRTKTGLDKLLSTGEQVAVLQADLEKMQPELEQAQVCVYMVCVGGACVCVCMGCTVQLHRQEGECTKHCLVCSFPPILILLSSLFSLSVRALMSHPLYFLSCASFVFPLLCSFLLHFISFPSSPLSPFPHSLH